MNSVLSILLILLLVFMNGFFVAAEFSFVGARKTRITQLASEGNQGAKAAEKAILHLDSYIAATQLGITLASLSLGWVGEPAISHLIEPVLTLFLPESAAAALGTTISVVIAFSIVTMLHIILGELTPKAIALQRPEDVSILVARPVSWFLAIFRPVIWAMNGLGNGVVRLLGFEISGEHTRVHSAEELEMLVHSSTEAGVLQQNEENLLRRVFDFSEIMIEEVMQPRMEIDAIPLDMPIHKAIRYAAERHHSRYPIYDASLDDIVGVLHMKDLLERMSYHSALLTSTDSVALLKDSFREPLFIPASVSVDRVLEGMQRHQMHFAIVVDEYGGTAGVATMEDILELIVGDVQDEFDKMLEIQLTPNNMVIGGLESMSIIVERFGEAEQDTLSFTIGGYVSERLDRIPSAGDRVKYGQYEIVVEAMDGMRVSRVRFIPVDAQ